MHDSKPKAIAPISSEQSKTENEEKAVDLGIRIRLEADVPADVIRRAATGPRPKNARMHFLSALEALNKAYSTFVNAASVHLGTTFVSVADGLGSATFSRAPGDTDAHGPTVLTMVRVDNVPALDIPNQEPSSPAILDDRFWSVFQNDESPMVCSKCQAPAVIRLTHSTPADSEAGFPPKAVRKEIVITYNCPCNAFGADTLTLIHGGKDELPRGQLSLELDTKDEE